eukprot:6367346-Amphidinium_carterae.1
MLFIFQLAAALYHGRESLWPGMPNPSWRFTNAAWQPQAIANDALSYACSATAATVELSFCRRALAAATATDFTD